MREAENKGRSVEPITIEGGAVTISWWGKTWRENFEKYADFASRLERGKRYVRTGTVVDLQIHAERIRARVQERRKAPYRVEIHISSSKEKDCQRVVQACTNRVENLKALLNGEFPQNLQELFIDGSGLFPDPREISLQCSCPD